MTQTTLIERPLAHESIEDETGTSACDACDGSPDGCEDCYRGRVSGYRETDRVIRRALYDEPVYVPVPCNAEQRVLVDAYFASDRLCPLCDRRVPTTRALPLCEACAATGRVAGQMAAEAQRQDREVAA